MNTRFWIQGLYLAKHLLLSASPLNDAQVLLFSPFLKSYVRVRLKWNMCFKQYFPVLIIKLDYLIMT